MSTITTPIPTITFPVDDIKPAEQPLEECRAYEAVKQTLGGDIESCSDYHSMVVADVDYQPLLAAVHLAFSQHRPLVLSPDCLWITIAQGVAHHMAIHAGQLRSRFVAHQGKLDLKFFCDWPERSPENPWPQAFASWAEQIRQHVGPDVHGLLTCDFSTSGPIERAASDIVMMDVFERYFHYRAYCICGIPAITLEGTPQDWQRVRDKAAGLTIFDMDWWLKHLLPICDQFVRASRGEVDQPHWRNICKLRDDYGGDIINGWIAKLFPYLRAFPDGPCNNRNPIFETDEGFQTTAAPSGLSRVPFTWTNLLTDRSREMEAIGGLVGVTQDAQTLALRPKVGWAVREAEKLGVLLAKLTSEHTTLSAAPQETSDDPFDESDLPEDLTEFYARTDGADLFGRGKVAAFQIVPRKNIEPLNWGESGDRHYGPTGRIWNRIGTTRDGSWLAINLYPNRPQVPSFDPWPPLDPPKYPVCVCTSVTRARPGENPVIASSFTELLERLLASNGKPFWLEPGFQSYGDAERFTGLR